MAYKEKRDAINYNNEFNRINYDRINLTIPKGQRAVIKSAATQMGESANAYIYRAILERMWRDGFGISAPVEDL